MEETRLVLLGSGGAEEHEEHEESEDDDVCGSSSYEPDASELESIDGSELSELSEEETASELSEEETAGEWCGGTFVPYATCEAWLDGGTEHIIDEKKEGGVVEGTTVAEKKLGKHAVAFKNKNGVHSRQGVAADASAKKWSDASLLHEQEELVRVLARLNGAVAPTEANGIWTSTWPPYLGYAFDRALKPTSEVCAQSSIWLT